MPISTHFGTTIRFMPVAHPHQLDNAVTEVGAIMGPPAPEDRAQTDEYLAGFVDNHPLAQFGSFRLLMAVFEDSMHLVLMARRDPKKKDELHTRRFRSIEAAERKEILEALVWFISPGEEHICSFDSLVELFGLDVARMRRMTHTHLRMTADEVAAFIHAETPVVLAELPGRGRPRKHRP